MHSSFPPLPWFFESLPLDIDVVPTGDCFRVIPDRLVSRIRPGWMFSGDRRHKFFELLSGNMRTYMATPVRFAPCVAFLGLFYIIGYIQRIQRQAFLNLWSELYDLGPRYSQFHSWVILQNDLPYPPFTVDERGETHGIWEELPSVQTEPIDLVRRPQEITNTICRVHHPKKIWWGTYHPRAGRRTESNSKGTRRHSSVCLRTSPRQHGLRLGSIHRG